jgi:long-chain acyl-CoA synthetase
VCPASGGFDPDEIFALAAHFQRVHMFAAPTMVKRMTLAAQASGADGAGLRSVIYGGGPMYVADIEQAVARFGPIFIQIYGQGECPMAITTLSRAEVADRSHPNWRARLASVGRAQVSAELRIGDETGQPLPPGTVGEIMVRGDAVMPGYWQNPQANAKALLDGWLMTGDMGFLDEDGYLTLQDRSKDLIISGGSNIYPREVEEVVLQHPLVEEVSVVGAPHPDWGEIVVAFVVTTGGQPIDLAALDAHCMAHIARFKRPKQWRQVAALPKNNYGKVLKTTLRQWVADAGPGAEP